MKTLDSYQEIGTLIDQGRQSVFTCHPEARVSAIQRHRDSDGITVTINIHIQDTCVGIVEYEYASILAVLEAFAIEELAEVWEVLDL